MIKGKKVLMHCTGGIRCERATDIYIAIAIAIGITISISTTIFVLIYLYILFDLRVNPVHEYRDIYIYG